MVESVLYTDNLGTNGDEFYNLLMDAHEGLSEDQSHSLNARLVLMLANEIGNFETLKAVLKAASEFNHE